MERHQLKCRRCTILGVHHVRVCSPSPSGLVTSPTVRVVSASPRLIYIVGTSNDVQRVVSRVAEFHHSGSPASRHSHCTSCIAVSVVLRILIAPM